MRLAERWPMRGPGYAKACVWPIVAMKEYEDITTTVEYRCWSMSYLLLPRVISIPGDLMCSSVGIDGRGRICIFMTI